MLICYLTVFSICVNVVVCYNNKMYTLTSYENISESQCGSSLQKVPIQDMVKLKLAKDPDSQGGATPSTSGYSFVFLSITTTKPAGGPIVTKSGSDEGIPWESRELLKFCRHKRSDFDIFVNVILCTDLKRFFKKFYMAQLDVRKQEPQMEVGTGEDVDYLAHWPTGQVLRAETFQDKSGVHLPFFEYMHRGHCRLKVTKDYMQTAVDAFAILISGDITDILRLPASYVLQSARTIAMMRLAQEKYQATWAVVKGAMPPEQITFETLEKFRPLFKYINGREMARLNLSDDKILSFIGTHPELNRHQVGVVASKYIKVNPRWTEAKYLNIMNNLLCGVPMIFMRRIPENTYLQLTHQLFYHIRACDPLQRRFYLAMMMRTQALGKSYSWSAREVSRLGLLLAEVSGPALSAINPEAMAGLSAQVMLEMPIHSMRSMTDLQVRNLESKPYNILARKLNKARRMAVSSTTIRPFGSTVVLSFSSLTYILSVL